MTLRRYLVLGLAFALFVASASVVLNHLSSAIIERDSDLVLNLFFFSAAFTLLGGLLAVKAISPRVEEERESQLGL